MSSRLETIRHSELLHRLVLDRTTTDELGRVDVVWMHPDSHRVLGFVCKSGLLGKKRLAFNLGQIHNLGSEGIVVSSQPVETDAEQVSFLETFIGKALWNDAGDQLGKITDFIFNGSTGVIRDYLFRSQGWRGFADGLYRLPAEQIVSFGKKRVLVAERATHKLMLYEEGLQQKFSKVSDTLRDDIGDRLKEGYADVTQELQGSKTRLGRSLSEQTQEITKQAKGQFQQFAKQATQVAKTVSQRYEDGTLMEQVREKFQVPEPPARQSSEVEQKPSKNRPIDRPIDQWDDEEPWV
jgi:uncharacterized protein YrrD